MDLLNNLFGYKKVKLYDQRKTRKDERLNQPYDYSKTLMQNSLSRHILRNRMISQFLYFLNDYLFEVSKGIRTLKNYKNYTVDKDNFNTK